MIPKNIPLDFPQSTTLLIKTAHQPLLLFMSDSPGQVKM